MKKLLSLVLAVAMLLSLCACGSKEATSNPGATDDESGIAPLNITFNVAVSGEMYDAMTNKFAERCKELSDGAITVQTVAAGTLGSAREVVEACQLNSVNMIWAADSELDQVVGNLSWAWLPYTVTNYEQADEYYNEGWIDEAIAEICAEAGITCVAGSENGTRLMCTKGVIVDSIADVDNGYGNVINVKRTVEEYELAGVAGIQLEDQSWPKRCGHMEGKVLISAEEMVQKIRIAVASRKDPDFVIVARTDANTVLGFDEAIRRSNLYAEAGADIIFFESPTSDEQVEKIPDLVHAPVMLNMSEGAKTPLRNNAEIRSLGYKLVIWPSSATWAAARAIQEIYQILKDKGTTGEDLEKLILFHEFNDLIGLPEVMRLSDEYKTGTTY